MTTAVGPPEQYLYPDYCHVLSPTIGKWCPLRAVDVCALRDVGMFCDGIRLFHFLNHPVKWVRLTGVIVAVDEFPGKRNERTKEVGAGRMVYTLDDSSGVCIECTAIRPAEKEGETRVSAVGGAPRHLQQLADLQAQEQAKAKRSEKGKAEEDEKIPPSVQAPAIAWDEVDVGTVVKVKGRVGTFRDQKQVEVVKIEVLRCTDLEVRCWNEVREFRDEVLARPWVVSKEEEEKCKRKRERDLKRLRKEAQRERKGERVMTEGKERKEGTSKSRVRTEGRRGRNEDVGKEVRGRVR